MDFPKACPTNVLRIEDVASIAFSKRSLDPKATQIDCAETLSHLREAGILCCAYEHHIFTFNTTEYHASILADFHLEEEGSLGAHSEGERITILLQDAIEGGVAHEFATRADTYRLGPGNWIVCNEYGDNVRLQIQLRSVSPGDLSLVVSIRSTDLDQCSHGMTEPSDVLLSPFGIRASLETDRISSQALSANEQDARVTSDRLLKVFGILSTNHTFWVRVRIADRPDVVLWWPEHLCFVRKLQPAPPLPDANLTDSLTFAQEWVESAGERQQAILLEQHARNITNPLQHSDLDLVASPPFLNRPDLSNVSGVYPTPPDGMITSVASQLGTTQDNSLQASINAMQDGAELFRLHTHDRDGNMRPREYSIASSTGMDMQAPNTGELFSNTDGEFGAGEVDDNDFDFFDDETARNMLVRSSSNANELTEHVLETSQPEDTQINDSIVDTIMLDLTASPSQMEEQSLSTEKSDPEPSLLSIPTSSTIQMKPLSPFDIRERLLPPPIPASQASLITPQRRQSSFAPIVFNPAMRLNNHIEIGLRPHRPTINAKSSRAVSAASTPLSTSFAALTSRQENSSDDDSESSDDAAGRIPVLPWQEARKRKRDTSTDGVAPLWNITTDAKYSMAIVDVSSLLTILTDIFDEQAADFAETDTSTTLQSDSYRIVDDSPSKDLMVIAQLVSEQAITCTIQLALELNAYNLAGEHNDERRAIDLAINDIAHVVPIAKVADLGSLAILREPPRSGQLAKGQPRPPPRLDTTVFAELYPLPPPYLCVQRAEDNMEMLPPATNFWEALSLAPAHGTKDILPYHLFPSSNQIRDRMTAYADDFKSAFEGCKLGVVHGAVEASLISQNGAIALTSADIINQYQQSCHDLVDKLMDEAHTEMSYTYVVVILDMYDGKDIRFRQAIIACFVSLFNQYLERINRNAHLKSARDIFLQIIPAAMVCSANTIPFVTSSQMAVLAREVYDRSPPTKIVDRSSPLPIDTTPAIMLAESTPKRIGFQLTSTVATDLLYEGSELHVAYAKSADGMWITAVWIDNTGRGQKMQSFCLRGTSYAAIFAEIWSRSLDIIRARVVAWRVSIATQDRPDDLELDCWQQILTSPMQRKGGAIHVSFVLVNTTPALCVKHGYDRESTATQVAVITPVSTPQASGFTVSPDASGHAAPPTPTPTEPSGDDADAHLVDLPDETWGILLDTKYDLARRSSSDRVMLAQGALVKHGDKDIQAYLPVLGVSVVFTLRIRGNGSAVEDATAKQAEMLLKELLSAYRGLGLLAKLRGVQERYAEGLPVHILSATRGAKALFGLL